eukprot:4270354-Prymnesium_polylepis.1
MVWRVLDVRVRFGGVLVRAGVQHVAHQHHAVQQHAAAVHSMLLCARFCQVIMLPRARCGAVLP